MLLADLDIVTMKRLNHVMLDAVFFAFNAFM